MARAAVFASLLLVGTIAKRSQTTLDGETNTQADVDFDAAIRTIKEVDHHKKDDAFVVYETDGKSLTQVAKPESDKCSLDTFKEVLLGCGSRGTMCIGAYKFNYPRLLTSDTRKEKAILVLAQDPTTMKESLGSNFKVMQVTMPTINFVWKPLQPKLSKASFSPSATFELGDKGEIEELDPKFVFETISRSQTRIGATEKEAFIKHAEEMNAKTSGVTAVVAAPAAASSSSRPQSKKSSRSSHSRSKADAPAHSAPVDTKKIAADVEKIVEAKMENIVKTKAQDEVGRAIRKLGTDVGNAISNVGKTWMDKAKGMR